MTIGLRHLTGMVLGIGAVTTAGILLYSASTPFDLVVLAVLLWCLSPFGLMWILARRDHIGSLRMVELVVAAVMVTIGLHA